MEEKVRLEFKPKKSQKVTDLHPNEIEKIAKIRSTY